MKDIINKFKYEEKEGGEPDILFRIYNYNNLEEDNYNNRYSEVKIL